MQIVCPNCTTAYDVTPGTIGPAGRSVRCARCRTVWTATPVAETALAIVGATPAAAPPPRAATPVPPVAETEDAVAYQSAPPAAAEEEFVEGGSFDWSLSADEPARRALEPAAESAAEPGSQGAVDDIFSGGFGERIEAPSLVPDDEAAGAEDAQAA